MRGLEPALLALPRPPGLPQLPAPLFLLPLALSLAILPCFPLGSSLSSEISLSHAYLQQFWALPQVLVHYGARALAGQGAQVPTLLALLLSLIILTEDSLLGAAQCTCFLPDPQEKNQLTAWNCHPTPTGLFSPSILRDKSQRPPVSHVPSVRLSGTRD